MRQERSDAIGCTIGAKILEPDAEYVLFKNKDLNFDTFEDELAVDPDRFGIAGLHIPPPELQAGEVRSGFSIGLNAKGVSACNSHVRSIAGGQNYDLLTEAAVTGTASTAEACERVIDEAAKGDFNWSNIIVADSQTVAILEIGRHVEHVRELPQVARANQHLLPGSDAAAASPCPRGARIISAIETVQSVDDVLALLRSHEGRDEKSAFCSHGERGGKTVYSYAVHWRRGEFAFCVQQGPPCLGEYVQIPLGFPLDRDKVVATYPGALSSSGSAGKRS